MRHNVLVYLNYFYDENIKDHDRLWRTKVVFWNFLNTIYEIFVFSEIVVFLPEKHFGKKFGQNQNFSYVIRHEVKTFLSTIQSPFPLFLLLSPALCFSSSSPFYLPMIRDIQIVLGEALMRHRGLRNFFWWESNFEQDFQWLKYFPQLFRYFNYTKIQQVRVFYHSLWKIWCKRTWETSLSVWERFSFGGGGGRDQQAGHLMSCGN